ncbi:DUF1173 family protein [Ralstonia pseudosolanacearum]|uniref:DUF1173 family protein n=1 Tax=Ralstonia pseudosolanacearum TaxID=1310165 RepID=UPI0026F7E15A|nr:DUF1173 family protein [Ralstonia pseudosolanacearum]MDO3615403.1 DUF1173 family protein [Ralstonia pseudosolanacearum]
MIKIRIGPSDFDLAEVLENPGRYTAQLERAKRIQGFAECGCTEHAPRPKLVIRRLRSSFILARWPDAAYKHRQGCPFQERQGHASTTAQTKGPFQTRNGAHLINLDLSLTVAAPSAGQPGSRTPQAPSSPRAHRRSAPLLAFLEYAWEAAGLHAWADQGYRGWNACWSMLSAELADSKINGRLAADVLHIMRKWDPDQKAEILAEFDGFTARLAPAGATTHRGLIIGEIGTFKPSAHGGMLVLRQSQQRYFMSNALFQGISRSYATALAGLERQDLRCVAILAIEKTGNGYLHVAGMAAMLANSTFLPCDSSHEAVMADHLIRLQRRFEKPLRHVGAAAVHPDFVLTDTDQPTVIEVLGMTGNPEYDRRMLEKREYYQTNGIRLVEWNPTAHPVADVHLPPARRGG